MVREVPAPQPVEGREAVAGDVRAQGHRDAGVVLDVVDPAQLGQEQPSDGPLLCGLAKSRYYLLLNEPLAGEEAERIGLVARCVEDEQVYPTALEVARRLAHGSATAMRWTKHALNNWLRLAGPSFDTSLALEFLGFRLSDVREGLKALKAKRRADP